MKDVRDAIYSDAEFRATEREETQDYNTEFLSDWEMFGNSKDLNESQSIRELITLSDVKDYKKLFLHDWVLHRYVLALFKDEKYETEIPVLNYIFFSDKSPKLEMR